jgi:hypothetical protein
MPDKIFLVRMKAPSGALQYVCASRAEFYGEHLAFLDSEGELAALFLMEIVESWIEIASDPVATKLGLARRCRRYF